MRTKSFLLVVGLLVVLVAGVGGMLAYDSSHKDQIGKAVSVGHVDISGLSVAAAREKLRRELVNPLQRPVVARYKGRHFTLTAEQARVAVDVDRTIRTAVDRSRSGGIVSRTLRGLTGGKTNAHLDVAVSYDRSAVRDLVARVSEKLERPPVDADVNISVSGVTAKQAHRGLAVDTSALSRALKRQLVSATAARVVPVRTETLRPKVTTRELTTKYPSVIIVDRGAHMLKLYERLKETKDYRIAVGMAGLETPAGRYNIQDKQVNPSWHVPNSAWAGSLAGTTVPPGPSNPIKARWMGIYNGAGIHGTSDIGSLGTSASHGCIRMAVPDVEALFEKVDVGTPVYIA